MLEVNYDCHMPHVRCCTLLSTKISLSWLEMGRYFRPLSHWSFKLGQYLRETCELVVFPFFWLRGWQQTISSAMQHAVNSVKRQQRPKHTASCWPTKLLQQTACNASTGSDEMCKLTFAVTYRSSCVASPSAYNQITILRGDNTKSNGETDHVLTNQWQP